MNLESRTQFPTRSNTEGAEKPLEASGTFNFLAGKKKSGNYHSRF